MRAVVVIGDVAERDMVSRALQRAGFAVARAGDAATGIAAVAREAADVVLFAWTPGLDFVRPARAADASGRAQFVALVDPAVGPRGAMAAGAHDALVRPFPEAELVSRLKVAMALARRPSGDRPGNLDGRPPDSRRLEVRGGGVDIRRLAVWRNIGTIVAADLTEMVGRTVLVSAGFPAGLGQPLRCATIPMTLASEGLELAVSVAADPATQSWLGGALIGDPSAGESAVGDILRELASTAGGAVKRAVLPENITLTTGLPVNAPSVRHHGDAVTSFGLVLERGTATLALVAEVRRRENRHVRASELVEGMVVVHDVRSRSGVLLVTAGSRLTRTTAERLGALLGTRCLLEVAAAA